MTWETARWAGARRQGVDQPGHHAVRIVTVGTRWSAVPRSTATGRGRSRRLLASPAGMSRMRLRSSVEVAAAPSGVLVRACGVGRRDGVVVDVDLRVGGDLLGVGVQPCCPGSGADIEELPTPASPPR